MWMERNVLRDDAKRSVENIGKSKTFYAAALNLLKRDFGNAFHASHTNLVKCSTSHKLKQTTAEHLEISIKRLNV